MTVIAGTLDGARAPAPAPASWAARPEGEVAIWSVRMAPGAAWRLPAAPAGVNRTVYWFRGGELRLDERSLPRRSLAALRAEAAPRLRNGGEESELLLLQGRPIAEPVAHHGPFVMNSQEELLEAFRDYQRTEFGGWPWERDDPVHPAGQGRHARHPDGRLEEPGRLAGGAGAH